MKNCPRCDANVEINDKFCGYCGFNLLLSKSGSLFTQQELKVGDIRMNLGIVYLKQGKYDLAIENFEKVLQHDPNNSTAKQMIEKAKEVQ